MDAGQRLIRARCPPFFPLDGIGRPMRHGLLPDPPGERGREAPPRPAAVCGTAARSGAAAVAGPIRGSLNESFE